MIRFLEYNNGKVNNCTDSNIDKIKDNVEEQINHNDDYLLWIDMENPEEDEVNALKDIFQFHELTIEDCVHRHQRPKVDKYEEYYFMVFSTLKGKDLNKKMNYNNIYIFIGKKYIVTIYWSNQEVIDNLYSRVASSSKLMSKGSDFLLYNILDEITDDYFPIVDKVEEKIDHIEERILKNPSNEIQDEIIILKRNMLKLRKTLSPQREVLNILLRHDYDIISEENRLYYMDIYDHLMRMFDLIETYQDLLSGATEMYMSQISNRMNEKMKVLTIITTILMPMSIIPAIYGMNFTYIPELQYKYGYFVCLAVMLGLGIGGYMYFKIKKWI